jgi:cellulose synthase/poly-beta-1,6-N-acetylglucosamine synthase-like glycosyltransferase
VTAAVVVVVVSIVAIAWVYAGYPAWLALLGKLRPRPRVRAPLARQVSVIVAAHNEEPIIGAKIANLRLTEYPAAQLEVVVVSDGSTDGTVAAAEAAGASLVLDLPRVGKLRALNDAVSRSSGDVLVFTDADSLLEPGTLPALVANFADPDVGAVAAKEVHAVAGDGPAVAHGEGLYWRYEQLVKRLEDRVGSAVSASGRLYATRRDLFVPSRETASTDDFVISTQAVRAGRRLAFDDDARVLVATPDEGGTELWRKVRVMNRGLRGAFALAGALLPFHRPAYLLQLLSHKVLRRFLGFFLAALLLASLWLAIRDPRWWALLAPQLAFYALAIGGALAAALGRRAPRALWVPYYFCLSNLAATIAVCLLVRGRRFEVWEPALTRGATTEAKVAT